MTSTAEGSSAQESEANASDDTRLPLDAVANLRLLGEVQRRGLEAAELVIARLTERTNAPGRDTTQPAQAAQMTAMTDAFIESVSAAVAAMSPAIDRLQPSSTGRPGEPGRPEVLSARGAPCEQIDVELWMHNYTDEPATGVEVHLSELIGAHGARMPSSCVTMRPDEPFDLSAESSRSVTLRIDLPPGTATGRYRGIVTAAHLADLWLVLELDVDGNSDPAP